MQRTEILCFTGLTNVEQNVTIAEGLNVYKGEKGEPGLSGPKGDVGLKGDPGVIGETGQTGSKGRNDHYNECLQARKSFNYLLARFCTIRSSLIHFACIGVAPP